MSFSYVPERPLIRDFQLAVKPGMKVAIVGPTGAGKTTLVNLLMRFYEVDGGAIEVDGQDISAVTRTACAAALDGAAGNVAVCRNHTRQHCLRPAGGHRRSRRAAARAAHAHSFIRRLPDGYRTMIAEDGGNLSQGQKQLLTIARAMLLDPPMLILDEATSSVDIPDRNAHPEGVPPDDAGKPPL